MSITSLKLCQQAQVHTSKYLRSGLFAPSQLAALQRSKLNLLTRTIGSSSLLRRNAHYQVQKTNTLFSSYASPRQLRLNPNDNVDEATSFFYSQDYGDNHKVNGSSHNETSTSTVKEDPSLNLTPEEASLAARYARQREYEEEAINDAVERYSKMKEELEKIGLGACLKPAERLLVSWFDPLTDAIRKEQEAIAEGTSAIDGATVYGSYLTLLPAEKLAVITIHTILGLQLSGPDRVTFTKAVFEVAEAVQAELTLFRLKKGRQYGLYKYLTGGNLSIRTINMKTKAISDEGSWSNKVIGFLGATLISKLLDTAKVETGESAFRHEYKTSVDGKTLGMVTAHEKVFTMIEEGHEIRKTTHARHLPMIVPPKDWTSPQEGGYLSVSTPIIRYKGFRKQLNELLKLDQMQPDAMKSIYKGLNSLSATPWNINKEIYFVIEEAWKAGGGIADLPSRQNLPVPLKPENLTDEESLLWKKQLKKVQQLNQDLHSLRCDTSYKLKVAQEFLGETIYFPHNMDFRGRTYPIPPHLNHLGSDLCRSLLIFAEGKPLGPQGLDWLKIHVCNLYGLDKIPFEDRIKFATEHLDDIMDANDNPLNGKRWWLNADYPWQCLATCMEITRAIRSGDPASYVSHLPVHQDGTCNGLQHYAALGGDVLGGKHVNLLPSFTPQDVYSGVADIVRKRVREEAEAGNPLAIKLKDRIERKVVKQTVMTSVYGVTFVGASRQIASQLKDLKFLEDDEVYKAGSYLARHTFASLGEIFLGAQTIMDWLAACARKIAMEAEQEVAWVTPLGLRVIQPYKRTDGNSEYVRTVVQTICLKSLEGLKVSVARQKSAFAPNYIHSLDSTHMLLTALKMQEKGLTFASVHDSYWTHACTVNEMNQTLREQFIALHSRSLLQDLLDNFKERYPGLEFPPLPKKGELDLSKVADSKYFFH